MKNCLNCKEPLDKSADSDECIYCRMPIVENLKKLPEEIQYVKDKYNNRLLIFGIVFAVLFVSMLSSGNGASIPLGSFVLYGGFAIYMIHEKNKRIRFLESLKK